jgi:signal transduction histidine kinase
MDASGRVTDPVHVTAATLELPPEPRSRLRYPITAQFRRDLGYMFATLATSIVSFTVLVSGLSIAVSFAVLIVGIPVVVGVAYVNRGVTALQRRLSGWQRGERIVAVYKRPSQRGFIPRIMAVLTDAQTWRDMAWLSFDAVIGFVFGIVAVVLWGVVVGSLFLPAWWWSMPSDAMYLGFALDNTVESLLGVALGLVLLPLAISLTRVLAVSHSRVAAALLGPGNRQRVEELTESRAGAVDVAHAELQRIERDLHDGAQARLVALAMDLGRAESKVSEDPEAGRELIGEAREEALRALGELRELVRGIGPSILRDRGLEAAIASLATGRAQPVDVQVDIGEPRPPATVEAAAYFVVAESIANAAKHSGASRMSVRVWRDAANRIVVECSDDGRGGADPAAGTGLTGLMQRVRALDGTLSVTSPAGGPTTVRAEIPCA